MLINTIRAVGKTDACPKVTAVRSCIDTLTFDSVDITVDVAVFNPFPFALRDPEIELYLSVESAILQHVIAQIDSDLPPRKNSTVRFHLHVDNALLVGNCANQNRAATIPFELNGVLTASPFRGNLKMPFKHQNLLPVLKMPSITDTNLYIFKAGENKGSVSAEVELHNPNSFPVDIHELHFDLVNQRHAVRDLHAVEEDGPLPARQSRWVALRGDLDSAMALARALSDKLSSPLAATCHGDLHTPFEVPLDQREEATREEAAPNPSSPGHRQQK